MNPHHRTNALRERLNASHEIQYGFCVTSRNCVDAIIALANQLEIPIMLLATRSQVEYEKVGKGYVNGWSTRELSEYIDLHDKGGYVVLCRDHGGLSEEHGSVLEGQTFTNALRAAKESLLEDIRRNFSIIHVDVSYMFDETSKLDKRIALLLELYQFCNSNSKHELSFEISIVKQTGLIDDIFLYKQLLDEFAIFCIRNSLPRPLFVTTNLGTLVRGNYNAGDIRRVDSLDSGYMEKVRMLTNCAALHNAFVKVHNADYLPDSSFQYLTKVGVRAANIGPEIGAFETLFILRLCNDLGKKKLREKFIKHFYESRKWEKWVAPDTPISDLDKAIICGHYNYSTAEFKDTFSELSMETERRGHNIHSMIVEHLKNVIKRRII